MRNVLDDLAVSFGASMREAIEQLGAITIFFFKIMQAVPASVKRFHLITEQIMILGVTSIPIIFFTSMFVGFVSAWQVQYLFANALPMDYLGMAVGKAVFTELGPVFTALVITGRIGAKLAAELGTMRVTEQIDAMMCLSLDPFHYLLAPRMIAGVIVLPMLTVFMSLIAVVSAQVLSELAMNVSSATFYQGLKMLFRIEDIVICLVKAFVFGGVITLSGCYYGFLTKGGAVGVGKSTRMAVVAAMILIIMTNFIVVNVLL